jgi:hypothetical protein
MKKTILMIIVVTVVFIGCSNKYRFPKFDYNNGPNPCINAFKDKVFFSILRESYKGTDAFKEIGKRDVGNPYDGLPPTLNAKIDSIAKDFVKKLPRPALCDECSKEQNYFMAQALHFYRSHELDAITKAELGKFGSYELCNTKE